MPEHNQFHLHVHEGATPAAVRAAVEAYHAGPTKTTTVVPDARAEMTIDERVALAERAYLSRPAT